MRLSLKYSDSSTSSITTTFPSQGLTTPFLVLSEKRAKAVYDYLITKVKNKLSYIGYGESRRLVPNDSDNARGLNRRTSFVIQ